MQKIDSHQHFWIYNEVRDAWITNDMKDIQRNFLPQDLLPLLRKNDFTGCIAVQADQSTEETDFLLNLANENDFIQAVVGWIDLRAKNIKEQLQHYASFKKLKGLRHIVQAEIEDDFLLRDDFCDGISLLQKFNFTYDILIYPKHLKYTIDFVKRFPEQPFVIDHLAKPNIKYKEIETWAKDIKELAKFSNVYCKLSGMVTEADWKRWTIADFKSYIDCVLENFGTDKVMFGSDWPVCLVAASYKQCCDILEQNTLHLTSTEKEKLWAKNAIQFYNI